MIDMMVNSTFNQRCKDNNIDFMLQDKLLVPKINNSLEKEDFRKLIYINTKTNRVVYFLEDGIDEDGDAFIYHYDLDGFIDYCKGKVSTINHVEKDSNYLDFDSIKYSCSEGDCVPFIFEKAKDESDGDNRHKYAERFVKMLLKETEEMKRQKKLEEINRRKKEIPYNNEENSALSSTKQGLIDYIRRTKEGVGSE